jgi:hypothetical protein
MKYRPQRNADDPEAGTSLLENYLKKSPSLPQRKGGNLPLVVDGI